ncbi:flavin reductase [Bacteriovoracaceae bacterium]|nr:flavin reductase [Bacteriovoracaceae bacterium]
MKKNWMSVTLLLAGIYNIIWGTWVVLLPHQVFNLTGTSLPKYPEFWQCIGMIVAVYGLGYILAAKSPLKHWPITLVGFLGKIFGPIGFVQAISNDVFPLSFGWNIIFNDLIWWIPFGLILMKAYHYHLPKKKKLRTVLQDEFSNFPDRKRAAFINSLTGLKSVHLVGTQDDEGNTNLSIVSSVFHLGASPALIGFIVRPDSARRDTLNNIRSNKHFTLNHIHEEILENSHQTSARYPQEQSEFNACELSVQTLNDFPAPFVEESRLKYSLELVREEKLEENGTHLIIAKVTGVYLPEGAISDSGAIDYEMINPIAACGLDAYYEAFKLGRLSYAKPEKRPYWL